jgi:hypothetical protein
MASKFEINIGSKFSAIKQQVATAKAMGAKVGAGTLDGILHGGGVFKSLERAIKDLEKATKNQTKETKRRTGGGSGGRGGIPSLGGDAATGISRIGATLPIAGAALAAGGFVMSQVMKIGHAYLAKISEQLGTAGIGGLQSKNLAGYYNAAQTGELSKSWRMSAGRYGAGGRFGSALHYGRLYGIGTGEIGQQLGLMDRFGGNAGRKFSAITGMAGARGIQTDLPVLLRGIASELEDAVRRGVNASELPITMGRSVSNMVGANKGMATTQSALEQYKSYMAGGKAVGEGNVEGIANTRMLMAGRSAVKQYMGMATNDKRRTAFNAAMKSAGLSDADISGAKLDYGNLNTLAMLLAEHNDPLLQENYEKWVLNTFGGKGKGNKLENLTSMRYGKQGIGGYHGTSSTTGIAQYFNYLAAGGAAPKVGRTETVLANQDMAGRYRTNVGKLGDFQAQQLAQEALLLSKMGRNMGIVVLTVNESLMNLANTLQNNVIPTLNRAAGYAGGRIKENKSVFPDMNFDILK